MKSSTIRRSTLSRETMEVIENLAKDQDANGLPNEYVRPEDLELSQDSESAASKAQEIDLLWQTFKSTQFNTKSPTAYLSLGFAAGVISTLIVLGCFGIFVAKSDVNVHLPKKSIFSSAKFNIFAKKPVEQTLEQQADNAQDSVDQRVSIPGENETASQVPGTVSEQSQEISEPIVDMKNAKKYIVKDGDTGESIIKHYFGTWSVEKAEMIMKANNLKNLDRINIGQVLIIPMEE